MSARRLLVILVACIVIWLLLMGCHPTRHRDVTILLDGQRRVISTEAYTVRDVLQEAGVRLGDLDRVEPDLYAEIEPGMTISVVRVEERYITERQVLPFAHRTVKSEGIPEGETRLIQLGVNGEEELLYKITFENGVEVSRVEVRRTVLVEPVDEITVVGTVGVAQSVPIQGTLAYISAGNAWLMRGVSGGRQPLTTAGDLDGRVFDLSASNGCLLFSRRGGDELTAPLNTLWAITTTVVGEKAYPLGIEGVIYAQWSPDGTQIAYSTAERTGGSPGWRANNDLWIAPFPIHSNPDQVITTTGGLTKTVSGGIVATQVLSASFQGTYSWWGPTFAWSPDGQRLAYATADEVGFVDVDSREQTPLMHFPPFRTYSEWVWTPALSWSPDGRFILCTLHNPNGEGDVPEDSQVFDVWALSADGTVRVRLAAEAGMWANPRWSPVYTATQTVNESQIVYGQARYPASSQDSRYDLYLMDRDGSNRHLIFPPPGESGVRVPQMAWSPDARQLAVVYDGNLYLVNLADNRIFQLTGDGQCSQPRWSGM
ncbi:MAG: G5 domain-containing protein [Anaerolineae bacterium]|jgi:Tol biopolymer transport system component|nr:G5 domain-containing protein [Anaerolineae bacterium]MDH7472571.1 G5 domain-containing protein [Anaerolineae bacterium]